MTTQKQKLFERVVTNGLYVDLATVPSQRAAAGNKRYEVIDQSGRLLGKGSTKRPKGRVHVTRGKMLA